MRKISLPITEKTIRDLRAGDEVSISGIIYTARDQAHKRLVGTINKGRKLPFGLKGQIIYYCGPTPAPKGKIIGSSGPTTAGRMDGFTPVLLKAGLKGMIGKGRRSEEIKAAIKKFRAIYFATFAGCGALLSQHIKKAEVFAYADLGPEAIYKLEVENFPLIVALDIKGKSTYV